MGTDGGHRSRFARARQRVRAFEDSLETSVKPWAVLTAITFAVTALWTIGSWLLGGDLDGR